jgi:hypothetical protein
MKEDILEQVVDDWFLSQKGVFTKHNVKFRPEPTDPNYKTKADSSFSDIDVLAYDIHAEGHKRVYVVTCKSWQGGINPEKWVKDLSNSIESKMGNRNSWKFFRELVSQKWSNAFVRAIQKETNQTMFTYLVVCTKLYGNHDKKVFEENPTFINNLKKAGADVIIKIMTFEELFKNYFD